MRILVDGVEVNCQGAAVEIQATFAEWRSVVSAALHATMCGNGMSRLPGGQTVDVQLFAVPPLPGRGHNPIL